MNVAVLREKEDHPGEFDVDMQKINDQEDPDIEVYLYGNDGRFIGQETKKREELTKLSPVSKK